MLLKTVLFAILAAAYARPEDFTNYIQVCRRNNVAADKVEQAKVLMQEFSECLPGAALPLTRLVNELDDAQRQRNSTAVVSAAKGLCVKAPEIMTCSEKLAKANELCAMLTPKDIMIKIYKHAFNYVCDEEDHKTRLAKLSENGVLECITSRGVSQCLTAGVTMDPMKNLDLMSTCITRNADVCSSALGVQVGHVFEYVRSQY